jgi:hypothetical protein
MEGTDLTGFMDGNRHMLLPRGISGRAGDSEGGVIFSPDGQGYWLYLAKSFPS